jgi:polyisoprenoid-binding protein YceI
MHEIAPRIVATGRSRGGARDSSSRKEQSMKRLVGFAALAALMIASVAGAAPEKYNFDKAHTRVNFSVKHIFSKVPGGFNDFDGVIMFDEADPTKSSVDVTIKTTSVDTKNERRDNHLRSADFFEVEKFPTMTYTSRKITSAGGGKYKVEGDLTIKGITKPVTLDAELLGVAPFGQGKKAGFSATTTINRKDFNILWNRTLDSGGMLLGDDVWIALDVELDKDVPKPAEPAKPAEAPKPATGDKK